MDFEVGDRVQNGNNVATVVGIHAGKLWVANDGFDNEPYTSPQGLWTKRKPRFEVGKKYRRYNASYVAEVIWADDTHAILMWYYFSTYVNATRIATEVTSHNHTSRYKEVK